MKRFSVITATDASIAMAYRSWTKKQQARFDPGITGFNPTDMNTADHIRRVLQTFPGVFTSIGEFSIHKEFVSAKIAGEVAGLDDPELDRILSVTGEVGLISIIRNGLEAPFSKAGSAPACLDQLKAVFGRHPDSVIIWAHTGMGRIVRSIKKHAEVIENILKDPAFAHIYFDIAWDEVAKYLVSTPDATRTTADLINRYPDRFLFGTDGVAPRNQNDYLRVFYQYGPLWDLLSKEAVQKVRIGNYERLFDAAHAKVRAWGKPHPAD